MRVFSEIMDLELLLLLLAQDVEIPQYWPLDYVTCIAAEDCRV